MPKQLYFSTVDIIKEWEVGAGGNDGWWYGNNELKWSFTAPPSGRVLLEIGRITLSGPVSTRTFMIIGDNPPSGSGEAPGILFGDYGFFGYPNVGNIFVPEDQLGPYLTDFTLATISWTYALTGLTSGVSYTLWPYFQMTFATTTAGASVDLRDTYFRVMEIL
jgi:hypothetical protein